MFDMEPIIRQYVKEMDMQIRDECFQVARKFAVEVNEERLIKALTDARTFYDEGFRAGERAAMDRLVRCKDCVYCEKTYVNGKGFRICPASRMEITEMDFCSYAERRTDDDL